MDFQLIKVRIVSFAYQAGGLIVLAVVGSVISPEFRDVVVQHAGTGISGTLIALAFDGFVKQIRNMVVLKNAAAQVGGDGQSEPFVLI